MLFIGDDWAEDHHDIEIEGRDRARLTKARLPEGLEGITRFHALVAEHAPADWADLPPEEVADRVVIGIESDRGPWVTALRAAGYRVFVINPLSAARYRERHSTSGAKSDAGDAHVLAEIVRLDRDHHRQIAGDTDLVDAVKLLARAHQTAVWERTRQVLRLRSTLRQYFPAAVAAFRGLDREGLAAPVGAGAVPGTGREADPQPGGVRVTRPPAGITSRPRPMPCWRCCGHRRSAIRDRRGRLRGRRPGAGRHHHRVERPDHQLLEVLAEHFGRHPAADIYLSQPGFGVVLAARTLGEFGDDKKRFTDARARKNYSGQSPITRASGKKTIVHGPVRHEPPAR